MGKNQQYAPYRPELTTEQKERLERAANSLEEYVHIAVEEAKRQLSVARNSGGRKDALPDDPEVCLRLPAVDPRGQYSIIDMRFKQRTQAISSVLNLRDDNINKLAYDVLTNPTVLELESRLFQIAQRHRILTRAEKLCHNEAAADALHIQARKLECDPAVAELDIVLQGLEYLLDLREGDMPDEVRRYYEEHLDVSFTREQMEAGRRLVQTGEAKILYPDFDNVLLQVLFSTPENWGLSLEELEALRDEE